MPRWQDQLFIALSRSRQRRHRLFPDPDRPRGRGRNAGHDLARSGSAIADCTHVRRMRHGLPFTARLRLMMRRVCLRLRRRSILELAPSGMSVEDADGVGEAARACRNGAKASRVRNMDCRARRCDGRMGCHSRRRPRGAVHGPGICRAGRRCGATGSARSADAWTGRRGGSCGSKFEREGFLSSARLQADRSANADRGLADRRSNF